MPAVLARATPGLAVCRRFADVAVRGRRTRAAERRSFAPLLEQLVRSGELTPDAARNGWRRHMLRSAVTGRRAEMVDCSFRPCRLLQDEFLVFASDGLETPTEEQIAAPCGERERGRRGRRPYVRCARRRRSRSGQRDRPAAVRRGRCLERRTGTGSPAHPAMTGGGRRPADRPSRPNTACINGGVHNCSATP